MALGDGDEASYATRSRSSREWLMYGELVPLGGGDPIPLLKKKLLVGRRESCDIVLRFGNVSAHHCQLRIESGYWFVKDLNSRNGTPGMRQRGVVCHGQ